MSIDQEKRKRERMLTGSILGVGVRNSEGKWTKRELSYLRAPGDVFVQMLKMLILPLIMSSIMSVNGNEYALSVRERMAGFDPLPG